MDLLLDVRGGQLISKGSLRLTGRLLIQFFIVIVVILLLLLGFTVRVFCAGGTGVFISIRRNVLRRRIVSDGVRVGFTRRIFIFGLLDAVHFTEQLLPLFLILFEFSIDDAFQLGGLPCFGLFPFLAAFRDGIRIQWIGIADRSHLICFLLRDWFRSSRCTQGIEHFGQANLIGLLPFDVRLGNETRSSG